MGDWQEAPKGSLPWELNDHIGNLLKRASNLVRREIENTLRPLGMTTQQYLTMRYSKDVPGITHSDLEKFLHIEKSSVTSLVTGMEKKGWVTRRHHGEDARVKQIYLSESGLQLCNHAYEEVERVKNQVETFLTPQEADILKILLKKVIHTYEHHSPRPTT
ncbi:MarR family winged helix-turn-helix transcriptional regulator [Paenibacillus hexagrammi]|uniref:MarR family transcriptional regulator n=1 Tax=Paenibacillus hexagrammi TaxID=2908839 RepID=A0ABY3SQL4_9BACL|nr:MarR family transcriptional regulator [Paenibacillus sp. YPD9-1]UJF35758.1 MarR family transcriptional regulator [Paenibacillus sp. YPD9-1]